MNQNIGSSWQEQQDVDDVINKDNLFQHSLKAEVDNLLANTMSQNTENDLVKHSSFGFEHSELSLYHKSGELIMSVMIKKEREDLISCDQKDVEMMHENANGIQGEREVNDSIINFSRVFINQQNSKKQDFDVRKKQQFQKYQEPSSHIQNFFDDAFIEASSFDYDYPNQNKQNETIHMNVLDSSLLRDERDFLFTNLIPVNGSQMQEERICSCDDPDCLWNNCHRNRNFNIRRSRNDCLSKKQKKIQSSKIDQPQFLNIQEHKLKMSNGQWENQNTLPSKKAHITNNFEPHFQHNCRINVFLQNPQNIQRTQIIQSNDSDRQAYFMEDLQAIQEQEEIQFILSEMRNSHQFDSSQQIHQRTAKNKGKSQ